VREARRTEHLERLPHGLLEEHGARGVAVWRNPGHSFRLHGDMFGENARAFDALHVLHARSSERHV
jgi:hypothetical protein